MPKNQHYLPPAVQDNDISPAKQVLGKPGDKKQAGEHSNHRKNS